MFFPNGNVLIPSLRSALTGGRELRNDLWLPRKRQTTLDHAGAHRRDPRRDPAAALLAAGRTTRGTAAESADETAATTLVGVGAAAPDFTVELFDGARAIFVRRCAARSCCSTLGYVVPALPREELARVQRSSSTASAGARFPLPASVSRARSGAPSRRSASGRDTRSRWRSTPSGASYDLYANTNFIPGNFLIGRDGRVVAATGGLRRGGVRGADRHDRTNTRKKIIRCGTPTRFSTTPPKRMQKAIDHLEEELLNVRAGKASPNVLNGVMVDYFGSRCLRHGRCERHRARMPRRS